MNRQNWWRWIRERMDQALKYDPRPPHVIEEDGGRVIVSDGLDPESNAMTLAMYSRSPKSFLIHYLEVLVKGPAKFLSQYYVGYGHKSIGDCGSTTICIEDGSMLEAKAVQDNELYNGQEASTRYLNMQKQVVKNPLNTAFGYLIQNEWIHLYSFILGGLIPWLKEQNPILSGEKPGEYEKAIKAKAFDIARAFLPAGCTTYVGWHTNLRQAWDHVHKMMHHPLEEVRKRAGVILRALKEKYPSSFGYKLYETQEQYLAKCAEYYYHNEAGCPMFNFTHTIQHEITWAREILETRPAKSELPSWIEKYGQFNFKFLLDFGSFRDLQRHRSCVQRMPLLTTDHGFGEWYLDALPEHLRKEAVRILAIQEERLKQIEDPLVRQYYIAMGYKVTCDLTAGLPSATYIAELRSGQTVHPTLRVIAQKIGEALKQTIPYLALHCDMRPDEWSTTRGKHDIVKKDMS
jgi:thymidylate synthase ThyX